MVFVVLQYAKVFDSSMQVVVLQMDYVLNNFDVGSGFAMDSGFLLGSLVFSSSLQVIFFLKGSWFSYSRCFLCWLRFEYINIFSDALHICCYIWLTLFPFHA